MRKDSNASNDNDLGSREGFHDIPRKRRWIWVMFCLLLPLLAVSLYQGQLLFDSQVDVTSMTWLQFDKHCAPTSANKIVTQIECSQLRGTAIQWKGAVQSVRVTSIDNFFESLLGYLPASLRQRIRCLFDTKSSLISHDSGMKPNQCSLTELNSYSFDLDVVGPYGDRLVSSSKAQLLLSASNAFTEMLQLIEEGDVIQFVGYFDKYPIFRYPPRLKLLQLECIHCKKFQNEQNVDLRITPSKSGKLGAWHRLFGSLKFFFNFIVSPIIHVG